MNVEYQEFPQPNLVQIVGIEEEAVGEAGFGQMPAPDVQLQMKIPEGQQRRIRGKLIKSTVSPKTNIGSVVLELEKVNLELLYSRISQGRYSEFFFSYNPNKIIAKTMV